MEELNSKEKQEVIARCAKFAAMATQKDVSPHEAEIAKRMLAETLAKYSLSQMDIINRETYSQDVDVSFINPYGGQQRKRWEDYLMSGICKLFEVHPVTTPDPSSGETCYGLVGFKDDLLLVGYYYKFLRRQIHQTGKIKFTRQKERDSHGIGAVQVLISRLQVVIARRNEIVAETSTALVIKKHNAVEAEFTKHFPSIRKVRRTRDNVDRGAYLQGRADGQSMSLNKGVNGGTGRVTIGGGR